MVATTVYPQAGPHLSPQVPWKDLVYLTPAERLKELLLPLPWLVLSIYFYSGQWFALGALPSFYFFLTGLRLSHQAQHYSIGISKLGHDVVLFVLSILMCASMHAVQVSHLHHHRRCLREDDAEGAWAKYPWWVAMLLGPFFVVRLHFSAYQRASTEKRRWIAAELTTIAVALVFVAMFAPHAWQLHASAMLFGECLTGFFAVWTVHHHCEQDEIARTQRGRWLNFIFYNMFLHKEHHLYPQVPTTRLMTLAKRLDTASSGFNELEVFPRYPATFPLHRF